jgi:hypothetical protein
MTRFRLTLVADLLASLSTVSAAAQDPEPISDWSAPLFYSLPKPEKADPDDSADTGPYSTAGTEGTAPPQVLPLQTIPPCRIADTRGNGFSGQAGPPALNTGPRVFQISGAVAGIPLPCGIPITARAVSFQLTIVTPNSAGNLIAWPGGPAPTISVLNWSAAETALGNGTVVPLSESGSLSVQINAGIGGATGHLVLDVNGYYGPSLDDFFVHHFEASSVNSFMITDSTIGNADINPSAAIADTKLATIATAGKVADSALSSNVSKLGQTIEPAEIANLTRSVVIRVTDMTDCGTGAPTFIDFSSGVDARPDFGNTGSAGRRVFLAFDAVAGSPDQNFQVCSNFIVPLDYASGGEFRVYAALLTAPDPATEVLNCSAGRNFSAHGAAGTVQISSSSNGFYTCTPTLTGLAAGEYVDFAMMITSDGTMDDAVRLDAIEFRYVATH